MIMHGFNLTDLPSQSQALKRDKTPDRQNKIEGHLTLEQRYRMLDAIKDSFWNRWASQYLTELQERHIRQTKKQPDHKGDLAACRRCVRGHSLV